MSPELVGFLSSSASGVVAIIVCLINNTFQNNEMKKLIEYRLTELETKVDKHNNLIDRTYKLEQSLAVHEERLDKLEGSK